MHPADALPQHRHARRHDVVQINEYFAAHPEMVLGEHGQRRGIYGPGRLHLPAASRRRATARTARRRPRPAARRHLHAVGRVPVTLTTTPEDETVRRRHRGRRRHHQGRLLLHRQGRPPDADRQRRSPRRSRSRRPQGRRGDHAARPPRSSAPCCRSATPCATCCAPRRPTALGARRRSGCASPIPRSSATYGPINHTVVTVTTDPETGEERETHRRPNLAHFADDPDCWLVASIEDYDLESGLARMGPIFRERVIAPPAAPLITSAADALAVTLNETGRVDLDRLAELLECDPETALAAARYRGLPQSGDRGLGDGRRLPVRPRAHQARGRRSSRRARSAIRAQRRRAAAKCSRRTSVRPTSPRASAPPGFRPT